VFPTYSPPSKCLSFRKRVLVCGNVIPVGGFWGAKKAIDDSVVTQHHLSLSVARMNHGTNPIEDVGREDTCNPWQFWFVEPRSSYLTYHKTSQRKEPVDDTMNRLTGYAGAASIFSPRSEPWETSAILQTLFADRLTSALREPSHLEPRHEKNCSVAFHCCNKHQPLYPLPHKERIGS
jgi:hypothetical protein